MADNGLARDVEALAAGGGNGDVVREIVRRLLAFDQRKQTGVLAQGIEYVQHIPLSEFDGLGQPLPFTITPEECGRFLCEIFDLWWPERRKVRIRYFDNLAEALAGQKPGTCTMHETCDSYAVVEYNGDVYPCDFFVEKDLRIGERQSGFLV